MRAPERTVGERLGIQVLPWRDFELESADFPNINHVNAAGGHERVSRQMAHMVWA